jgi:hypothetical protein
MLQNDELNTYSNGEYSNVSSKDSEDEGFIHEEAKDNH